MTLTVLHSPLLDAAPGVRHAFFTRHGGVSVGLYDSLNVGLGSRDDPAAVAENRRRAAEAFGAPAEALVTAYQVHSATPVWAATPWPGSAPQADAVISRQPGLMMGALAADCAPVLIADPGARIVAAVHAGWRGALGGVVGATVAAMVEGGATPERMVAAVGPCIGPASYEVGLEFEATFMAQAPWSAAHFTPGAAPDKRQFDLPGFVLARLAMAGVGRAEWIGADTGSDPDFFSNRRAFKAGQPDYGRLLSAIMLTR